MLKVILFGYSQKVYSCRNIEQLTRENIPAMWLAAMQQPDYRTINEFRGKRMKLMMDELYETMIMKLIKDNYITMENYFLDGTKIEANANKYSFVWKKSTIRFEEKLKEKIQETLRFIEETAKAEDLEILADNLQDTVTDSPQLEEIAAEVEKHVAALSYEIEEETDIDATFMRMKEDHMKNGQLKPGYNVQMATENQFILFYTIHQRPTDTRCFIPHLEKLDSSSLPMPNTVIADAGYGSEENYLYAIGEEKEPRFDFLIPYGTYLKEKTRKAKKDIKNAKNWIYEEMDDCFICPNDRKVSFKKYQIKKNSSGHEQSYKIYECEDCTDCPLKAQCTKAKGNRQVHWTTVFEEMKAKAKATLECEDKAAIYSRRKVEVESVFGHIKGNRSFRRFSLRGLDKLHVEFGIVALAHNLLKVAGIRLATFLEQLWTKKELAENKLFSSAPLLI